MIMLAALMAMAGFTQHGGIKGSLAKLNAKLDSLPLSEVEVRTFGAH